MEASQLLHKKIHVGEFLLAVLLLVSSMMVLQIGGRTVFLLLQLAFCVFMALWTKKVPILKSFLINCIVIQVVLSAAFAMLSSIPMSYKKAAIYMSLLFVPLYFTLAYIQWGVENQFFRIHTIKTFLKVMCFTQLWWTILQFLSYKILGLDINRLIFEKLLHTVSSASFYKSGFEYMPSGFGWHPSVLAPITVISFFLFDSLFMKLIAVLVAMICGNSTALIGGMLCVAVEVAKYIIVAVRKVNIKKKHAIILLFLGTIGVAVLWKMGILQSVYEKVLYLLQRILGLADDGGSGDAHKRYFTAYPQIVEISSTIQILFGYGEGCSGHAYDLLFDQYTSLASWAVECDIMNILVSRGIIGFVLYYAMLLYIAIRGSKINYKYLFVVLIIALQGITYNVQFDWVFFIEVLLFISIKSGYDIFKRDMKWKLSKWQLICTADTCED